MNRDELSQADDRLPRATLLAVTAATVSGTIVIALVAGWLTHAREGTLRPSREWPERDLPPPSEHAAVQEEPYQLPRSGPLENEVARQRLDGYGWVDRRAGVVHIPVARAIELYLRAHGAEP